MHIVYSIYDKQSNRSVDADCKAQVVNKRCSDTSKKLFFALQFNNICSVEFPPIKETFLFISMVTVVHIKNNYTYTGHEGQYASIYEELPHNMK